MVTKMAAEMGLLWQQNGSRKGLNIIFSHTVAMVTKMAAEMGLLWQQNGLK